MNSPYVGGGGSAGAAASATYPESEDLTEEVRPPDLGRHDTGRSRVRQRGTLTLVNAAQLFNSLARLQHRLRGQIVKSDQVHCGERGKKLAFIVRRYLQ